MVGPGLVGGRPALLVSGWTAAGMLVTVNPQPAGQARAAA
jgi:flagellar biosynthesis component FlhA